MPRSVVLLRLFGGLASFAMNQSSPPPMRGLRADPFAKHMTRVLAISLQSSLQQPPHLGPRNKHPCLSLQEQHVSRHLWHELSSLDVRFPPAGLQQIPESQKTRHAVESVAEARDVRLCFSVFAKGKSL